MSKDAKLQKKVARAREKLRAAIERNPELGLGLRVAVAAALGANAAEAGKRLDQMDLSELSEEEADAFTTGHASASVGKALWEESDA